VKQFDSTEKRDVVHLGIDDDDDDRSEWLNQPEATLYNKTLIFPQNKDN
jgi:gluconate kinase